MTRSSMAWTVAALFGANAVTHGQSPYGLTERFPNTAFRMRSTGDKLSGKQLERVFTNLAFNQPTFLTNAGDGTDRIFVTERRGVVYVFPNASTVTAGNRSIFLDISGRVQTNVPSGEAGLFSVAFHPDFASNGKFYASYTDTIHGNIRIESQKFGKMMSRVSEFIVSAVDPDSAVAASERILIEFEQPWDNHNGGQIAFGLDGYLYMSFGDGRAPNDTLQNGQNRTNWFATVLRIDVDAQDPGLAYRIPPDNPYVGNVNGLKEEIFAYGFRNPWRFSIDRETGALWMGDVGEKRAEEIDIVVKGGNYGWGIMEGFQCLVGTGCDTSGKILPVYEYTRDKGTTITGGYVYRGTVHRSMQGLYVYGDYGARVIWGLEYSNGNVVRNVQISTSPQAISSFGEDEAGELYITGYNGSSSYIYRFKDNADAGLDSIPTRLANSGLFSNVETKTFSNGLIPYDVRSPLWSDGSAKTRFLALPDTSKISFSIDGFWTFPEDAVLVKNFYVDTVQGDPLSRKLVETRLLVKRWMGVEWDGFSYEWNEEQSDATLLPGNSTKLIQVQDASSPGGMRTVTHYFPSRSECAMCHTPVAGYVLGVRTAQLNGEFNYGGTIDHQLRSLNHVGVFTQDIGEEYQGHPLLTNPRDTSAGIAERARSYLDANCSQCHRPGGVLPTYGQIDLRASTALESAAMVDRGVYFGNLGISGARIIRPGSPDTSVLYLRMSRRGTNQMPPLATTVVDSEGAALVEEWIRTMTTTAVPVAAHDQPRTFRVYPAFPNPFNPSTSIQFDLPASSPVAVTIFDLRGRAIRLLTRGIRNEGKHEVQWDGTDDRGIVAASGIYMFLIEAGSFRSSGKMVIIR